MTRIRLGNWTRIDLDGDGKPDLLAAVQVLPRAGANLDPVLVRYQTTSRLLLLRGGSSGPPGRLAQLSWPSVITELFDLNGDGLLEIVLYGCSGRSECSYSVLVPRQRGKFWEELQ